MKDWSEELPVHVDVGADVGSVVVVSLVDVSVLDVVGELDASPPDDSVPVVSRGADSRTVTVVADGVAPASVGAGLENRSRLSVAS